jgi:hypothetical protein
MKLYFWRKNQKRKKKRLCFLVRVPMCADQKGSFLRLDALETVIVLKK